MMGFSYYKKGENPKISMRTAAEQMCLSTVVDKSVDKRVVLGIKVAIKPFLTLDKKRGKNCRKEQRLWINLEKAIIKGLFLGKKGENCG